MLYFHSGTALRCIPTLLTSPGRGPGLTENGSALRTARPLSLPLTTHRHLSPSLAASRSHTAQPHHHRLPDRVGGTRSHHCAADEASMKLRRLMQVFTREICTILKDGVTLLRFSASALGARQAARMVEW